MSPYRHTDDSALARLFAGGRHVRMLLAGCTPPGLVIPAVDGFERVAWLSWPGQPMPGSVVADPDRLPFIEALFDRALMTTQLPATSAKAELRELWRVLSPAALALLVVKARRPWQFAAPGWVRESLEPVLLEAMFDVLDWQVETLPDRYHLVLVGKHDGLRPALIGRVDEVVAPAAAT